MRTGEPRSALGSVAAPQAGFTYLWLLFVIAIGSAALAVLGQHWRTAVQRDRELELMFRAQQIAAALARYRAQSPAGTSPLPLRLADLLDDRRSGVSHRHLRRLYADPFTGQADWVLLTDERGGIQGLHSAARVPALITRGMGANDQADRGRGALVSDRVFMAGDVRRNAAADPTPSAASSASAPIETNE